jgi:hypothetical protein
MLNNSLNNFILSILLIFSIYIYRELTNLLNYEYQLKKLLIQITIYFLNYKSSTL